METLTAKEKETFERLVKLGDTEKLAFETVIANRKKADATDFYYSAYCL